MAKAHSWTEDTILLSKHVLFFLLKLTHRFTLQCSLPVFKLKELRKVSCLIKEYKYLYNTNTRSCF